MSELSIVSGGTTEDEPNADSQFKMNFTYLCQESCIRHLPIQNNYNNKMCYLIFKCRTKHFCYFLVYSYELSWPFKV